MVFAASLLDSSELENLGARNDFKNFDPNDLMGSIFPSFKSQQNRLNGVLSKQVYFKDLKNLLKQLFN